MPAVEANATNTVALWPGLAASTGAYLKRLNVPRRLLVPLLLTSVVGGLIGALLLLKTPQHTFLRLVPWLLLGGIAVRLRQHDPRKGRQDCRCG